MVRLLSWQISTYVHRCSGQVVQLKLGKPFIERLGSRPLPHGTMADAPGTLGLETDLNSSYATREQWNLR